MKKYLFAHSYPWAGRPFAGFIIGSKNPIAVAAADRHPMRRIIVRLLAHIRAAIRSTVVNLIPLFIVINIIYKISNPKSPLKSNGILISGS